MVTVQVLVPVQAPLQPLKVHPEAAVAVRLTWVLVGTATEQDAELQLTVPAATTDPEPLMAVVRFCVVNTKLAETDLSALMETEQVGDVPEQAPPHPVNT
jgi:hypothetical protein